MSNQHEVIEISDGAGRKTLKAYVVGLALCLILTLVPFALVARQLLAGMWLYISLSVLAVIQLIVQLICFLRLNTSAEGRWSLMPLLFTVLIVLVLVCGSLWIMYNLNYNMVH